MEKSQQKASFDLRDFRYKETLNQNQTQKTLFLLGSIKARQEQGQAVLIISPKLPLIQKNTNQEDKQLINFGEIKNIFENDVYGKFEVSCSSLYEIQTIFPAAQKHISKYRRKKIVLKRESAQEYESGRQELLKKQLAHVDWVQNILNGKAEAERVIYSDKDILLIPDFKFHDLEETSKLHILCIFKNECLHSLRDLKGEHVQLLQSVCKIIDEQLQKKFGQDVKFGKCRVFFHYKPTFYRLHLHIQSLNMDSRTCNVQRCHDLSSVIDNIKIKSDYYQKVSLNVLQQIRNE